MVTSGAASDICILMRVCEHQQESIEELAPLSSEQQQIADRVVAGHSVFFTGCAGQCCSPPAKWDSMHDRNFSFTFIATVAKGSINVHGMHLQPHRQTGDTRCDVGAGTGKSLLLKHILRALPQASTYVTASTGLAASVLGGTTLNAFAGMRHPSLPMWPCTSSVW